MKSFSMQNYKHYFNIYSYTHKKVGEVSRGHKGKKGNWMKTCYMLLQLFYPHVQIGNTWEKNHNNLFRITQLVNWGTAMQSQELLPNTNLLPLDSNYPQSQWLCLFSNRNSTLLQCFHLCYRSVWRGRS